MLASTPIPRYPHWTRTLSRWVLAGRDDGIDPDDRRIDWLRILPFIALHVACLAVLLVGVSPVAIAVAAGLYGVRMFALTAFYHRYFSHRAYRVHRVTQFAFALLGTSALQRGPLWWAAHHRHHHRYADTEKDFHSPTRLGFLYSHMGWFLSRGGFVTRREQIPDLLRYPELRWLEACNNLVPLALGVGLFTLGEWLATAHPELGTNGPQMLVWGFCISTVVLFHASVTINSLAHRFGRRRYATRDNSRNVWWLALLTFGEGWHNNHHRFPRAARQGHRWWEVDLTWYGLRCLQALGLVRDLKPVPARPADSDSPAPGRGRRR